MTGDTDTGAEGGAAASPCIADPLEEAKRIIAACHDAGLEVRVTGGVAVALISPSASREPLARTYQDIDFVMRSKQSDSLSAVMISLGYVPEEEFNVLHGQHRLFYLDRSNQREADVFLDRIEMCHELDLRDRLGVLDLTLTPADLLLSKLQVVKTNEKDYKDAIAVLADHDLTADDSGININRINDLCSSDWGWWRTVTMVAERTHKVAREMVMSPGGDALAHVPDRLRHLLAELERAPKSRKWKMRARVGDRVRWHEDPEDVDHD